MTGTVISPEPSVRGGGNPIRVLVVDDHDLVREGLVAILSRERDLRIVGEAASAEEALLRLEEVEPDIVILDYRLPGSDGIQLCREFAERQVRARVVILSAFIEEDIVTSALQAGAQAYVVKDVDAAQLISAIREVMGGRTVVDPKVNLRRLGGSGRPSEVRLRPSYVRILRLASQGFTAKEIATQTGLSAATVRSYLRDTYRRLNVSSRAEATTAALRLGIL